MGPHWPGPVYDPATTRLIYWDSGAFTYDRGGNLLAKSSPDTTWSFEYDALNRLVAFWSYTQLVARYAYDALGRRIVKRVYSGPPPATSA